MCLCTPRVWSPIAMLACSRPPSRLGLTPASVRHRSKRLYTVVWGLGFESRPRPQLLTLLTFEYRFQTDDHFNFKFKPASLETFNCEL